jgi:hypothetical protein
MDGNSLEHRVDYEDGQWEYLNLPLEDFQLKLDDDDFAKLSSMIHVTERV